MNRIFLYSFVYIITLLFYIVFISTNFADLIVFISFTLSTVLFIFTQESLPKGKYINIPEVYKYQSKRTSTYGHILAFTFGIITIFYALLSFNIQFRSGIYMLIAWPVMIIVAQQITIRYSKSIEQSTLYNYISQNISQDYQTLEKVVSWMHNSYKPSDNWDSFSIKVIQEFHDEASIPLLHETIGLYKEILSASDVTQEEIEEINKS